MDLPRVCGERDILINLASLIFNATNGEDVFLVFFLPVSGSEILARTSKMLLKNPTFTVNCPNIEG